MISTVAGARSQGYHRSMYVAAQHRRRGRRQRRPRPAGRARAARDRAPRRARRDKAPACARRSSRRRKPGLRFQRKDTEQYHVCLGAPGVSRSDRRRFAASILDAILGGSASSRLFQEIREKRGMAYAVYSFVVAVHRHRPDRHLRRHARGEPRRGARDRGASRSPTSPPAGCGRASSAREGEPEGPRRSSRWSRPRRA